MNTTVADPRVQRTGKSEPQSPEESALPSRHLPPSGVKGRRAPPLLLIVLGLVVAAGMATWRYEQTRAEAPATLLLQGNVDVRQVNLSFKVAGRIESLAVDEGDAVKAGQVVASLDPRYFEDDLRLARAQKDQAAANLEKLTNGSRPEEIAQARAQLGQQQANLKLARANLTRGEELSPSGAISKEDLDLRRQAVGVGEANVEYARQTLRLAVIGPRSEDVAAARAQLAQAIAQVVTAERRSEDSRLIAPNNGVILTRTREKGAIVNPGEVVFTLTLASPVWVRTYVGEPDLGSVQAGLQVTVTSDAVAGRTYNGQVGFISPTAEFTPKTVETRELRADLVYRLRIVVDDPDGGLRQGMPVTVSLALPGQRPRTFKDRLLEALWLDRFGLFNGGGR